MRVTTAIILGILVLATAARAQVTCNNFEVTAGMAGDRIAISVSTDLPESSRIIIEVTRRYWRKGQSGVFSLDYYATEHAASELRGGLKVDVSEDIVKKAMKRINEAAEFAGRGPVEISEMDSRFKIRVSLTMSQPDERFGPYNKKLVGSAVRQIDEYRGCKKLLYIEADPQKEEKKRAAEKVTLVKPVDFEPGRFYILRRSIKVGSHPEDLEGLPKSTRISEVYESSVVYIDRRVERDGLVWYRIAAAPAIDRDLSATGWLKSTDFDIKKHREVQAPLFLEKLEATGFLSENVDEQRWSLVGQAELDKKYEPLRLLRGVIEIKDGLEKAEAEAQARQAIWELLEKGKGEAAIFGLRREGDSAADAGEAWILPQGIDVPEALTPKAFVAQREKPLHSFVRITEAYTKERPKALKVGTAVYLKEEGSFEVKLFDDPTKMDGEAALRIAADSYGKIIGFRYVDLGGKTVIRYQVEDENGKKGWVVAEVVKPA